MNQIQHTDGSVSFDADDYMPEIPSEPAVPVSELREAAYRTQTDHYLLAYEGYMLEGRVVEAEEQKALYMAAKAAIREQFPDVEPSCQ